MKKPELLAPAGDMETFYATIKAGCDAVYIGGYSFGARAFASNFSDGEIKEAINYAHLYGVKVYVTVNTIVYENEVETFLNYVDFLYKEGVDALIIQDLGMIDLVRKTYPNLELHASTQMHIHNLEGVKFLEQLNFKRVVLARETDMNMLKKIRENTKLELEIFVHGALCVSYSGQCLMSSLIGGRSGNRGKCAGTCRQKYKLVDENDRSYKEDEYLLSMKDLCTLEKIDELINLGIDSFKLEGRMKRCEYVYLVTSIYRKAIDNYVKYGKTLVTNEDILNLKKIYNRKFTLGYLFTKDVINQYRPNHLGIKLGTIVKKENNMTFIKLNDDLVSGDGIRILNKKEDAGFTVNEMFSGKVKVKEAHKGNVIAIRNIKCDINDIVIKTTDKEQLETIKKQMLISKKIKIMGKVIVKVGCNLEIYVSDYKNNIYYESDYVAEKSLNKPLTKNLIEKQIKKTNDTPYVFEKLEIETDNISFASILKLNELRRKALNLLSEKRIEKRKYQKDIYKVEVPEFAKTKKTNFLIRNVNIYEKIKNEDFHDLYVLEKDYPQINDNRKVLKLDRVRLNNQKYDTPLLVSELGSIQKGAYTDFSFNVVNSYAVAFLHEIGISRVTLSYELTDEQINLLITNYKKRYKKLPNLELIIYGKEEMMISKFSLIKDLPKKHTYYLQDKFNNKYLINSYNDIMTIYNSRLRNMKNTQKYYDMGINYLRYEID